MLKRLLLVTCAFAVSFSVALWAHPQAPTGANASSSAAQNADKKIHLEGCVFPRQAMMANGHTTAQHGHMDEYVLTDAKVIAIAPGVSDSVDRPFALEQVPQERLSDLSGKRVDVSARLSGTDASPQLQVIAIIETVGQCRAKSDSPS